MLTDVALIGGTGVGDVLAAMPGQAVHIPTDAGQLAGRVVQHSTGPILLVSRHSGITKTPPHRVNYKAIALGLKRAGVKHCFATVAVGSLRADWPTSTLAVVTDFQDFTGRHPTLFDRQIVHTDFSAPFSQYGNWALTDAGKRHGLGVKDSAVYVCVNGPRYETPHEVQSLTKIGDVVGMTAATEAILCHEAGIEYSCLALVTNLAAGLNKEPLNHEEVTAEMLKNSKTVVSLLLTAVDLVRRGK